MKGKKIIIAVSAIILVLILGIGGMVFAYMNTDFLKSDEELFYKYLADARRKN